MPADFGELVAEVVTTVTGLVPVASIGIFVAAGMALTLAARFLRRVIKSAS